MLFRSRPGVDAPALRAEAARIDAIGKRQARMHAMGEISDSEMRAGSWARKSRLDEIAAKTLFGTDWPGPGVPDIKKNLDEFRGLPLAEEIQQQILSKTALTIWPA